MEVLLEAPEGEEAGRLWDMLAQAGYEVSWCPGPQGPSPVWCPLLDGARCALVDAADAVVCALGAEDQACRRVLEELGRLHPDVPVVVPTRHDEPVWVTVPAARIPTRSSVRDFLDAVGAAVRLHRR